MESQHLAERTENREVELRMLPWRRLQRQITRGLIGNKDILFERGAIGTNNDKELSRLVRETLNSLIRRRDKHQASFFESEEYGDVCSLLNFSNVSCPDISGDWEVDRGTSRKRAETNDFGLTSFDDLERVLSRQFRSNGTKPFQLHIGPGDGSLMRHLTTLHKPHAEWNEIGIGHRLLYSLEKTLRHFLLPERLGEPMAEQFVNILGIGLRKALRKSWFQASGPQMMQWEQKVPFCDLNDLLKFMGAQQISWLPELQSVSVDGLPKMAVPSPGRFEDERLDVVGDDVLGLLSAFDTPLELRLELLDTVFERSLVDAVAESAFYDEPDYWKRMTYPRTATPFLDLNRHASMSLLGFVPGWFREIPDIFPGAQFQLVSAWRSDSHVVKDFQQMFMNILHLLDEGGCFITDGIKRSYTNELRLEEILEVLADNPNFRAEVIMSCETDYPLALLVQRRHPERDFLSDEEKADCFTGVFFQGIEEVIARPDLQCLNEIRSLLNFATGGDVRAFKDSKITDSFNLAAISAFVEKCKAEKSDVDTERIKLQVGLSLEASRQDLSRAILKGIRGAGQVDQILTKQDLQSRVVRQQIRRLLLENLDHLVRPEQLFVPGFVHTFPRADIVCPSSADEQSSEVTQLNDHCSFPCDKLPDNAKVKSAESLERVSLRQLALQDRVREMMEEGIDSPIVILDFTDCLTNRLLSDQLSSILSPELFDQAVGSVPIAFQDPKKSNGAFIRNLDGIREIVRYYVSKGGIIISGGSWYSSTDEFGQSFQDHILSVILDEIEKPESKSRLLTLCFSTQAAARQIGRRYYNGLISIRPGAFEIGPIPQVLRKRGFKSPIFADLPEEMTMAMTHTDYVYDMRYDTAKRNRHCSFRSLANSAITHQPTAWTVFDDRLIAFLFHPEVPLVEGHRLSPEIERVTQQFRQQLHIHDPQHYLIKTGLLEQNWKQIAQSEKFRIKANAGHSLMINTLHHLAMSLKQDD